MNTTMRVSICVGILASCAAVWAVPLGTEFSFQGQLKQAGVPVNGTVDLEFTLWEAEADGNPVGLPVGINGAAASNGQFTSEVDFGVAAFDGDDRWLEAQVSGAILEARQTIATSPHARIADLAPRLGRIQRRVKERDERNSERTKSTPKRRDSQ